MSSPLATRSGLPPAGLPLRRRGAPTWRTSYRAAPQLDGVIRLNTNENPYPPSARLVQAITAITQQAAAGLNRYPDRDACQLRDDLAGYLGHGLSRDQVWAANGSNEIIQQLLLAFGGPGCCALGFEPSYSMHPVISGTRWIPTAKDGGFGIDPGRAVAAVRDTQPDLVIISSPNNPNGMAVPVAAIEAVCAAAPGMVIVDEAYAEFARGARDGQGSSLGLLARFPRLVVMRTMSKAFALAGARVGHVAADPAVIRALQVVRLPYHLCAVTQAVARAALAHASESLAAVSTICAQREDLVAWLRRRGLAAADSDANFVLFGKFSDRRAICQACSIEAC